MSAADDGHAPLNGTDVVYKTPLRVECNNMELETFVFTVYKPYMVDEIDPDNNFYTNFHNNCKYYSGTNFNINASICKINISYIL